MNSNGRRLVAGTIFLAWASTTFYRHVDVSDASLYRVIARNLAEDRAWTTMRYLPTAYPSFFEHLPFGLWPAAATIRLFGESALPVLALLLSLLTVWWVGRAAEAWAGIGGGLAAMVTLATTQNFFFHASLTLLDVPLLLAAALVLVGASADRLDARAGTALFLGTLVGVATKGPFGLVTPGAVIVARLVVERSLRWALAASALVVASTLPIGLFLATSEAWLEHYGREQLWASFTGQRPDGGGPWYFPAVQIANMFWPGLVAISLSIPPIHRRLAATTVAQRRALLQVALASLVGVVGLSLPARKVEHHVFVLFPLLSVWAGVALGPAVDRLIRASPTLVDRTLFGVLVAGLIAGPLRIARFFCGPPYVGSTEFAAFLDQLPPKTEIDIVSDGPPWMTLSALSAERRLVPFHVPTATRPWAMVEERRWTAEMGLTEVARARGWVLGHRE